MVLPIPCSSFIQLFGVEGCNQSKGVILMSVKPALRSVLANDHTWPFERPLFPTRTL
jgi:hypothetical protein